MKKLLLLLLLFSALVFQSCNKISNIDEDLVPIVFSQTEITKALGTLADPIDALVLGSITSNDWKTIYYSTAIINGDEGKYHANKTISLVTGNAAANSTFEPVVAYPPAKEVYGIYIKALAPQSKITSIRPQNTPDREAFVANNTVTFEIDGTDDIMATGKTRSAVEAGANGTDLPIHGYGIRTNPEVSLVFDHLLSKINFYIVAERGAKTHWGRFESLNFLGGYTSLNYNLVDHEISLPDPNANGVGDFRATNVHTTAQGPVIPEKLLAANVDGGWGEKLACSVFIYPQGSDNYKLEVKTKSENGDKIVTTNVDLTSFEYEKGKRYKFIITFSKSVEMGFKVYITEWDAIGQGETPHI